MSDDMQGALDGILVADFTRILAGPYATMLLADMGARVIKVESPAGDDTRTWMPPVRDGVSTYYLGINRNKHSIALDLRDPVDLRLAQELAARADVMIENFMPGGLDRFGLDHASVSRTNPDVIYASITGFGSSPEGAALPGYDLMIQALSGLMSMTGSNDGPAQRVGVAVFDVMAGLHAAIGILAALNHRYRTGQGQRIEVSLLASALSGLVNHASGYVAGGTVPFRMGNAHPSLFPYEPLPTADGELVVIAGNDRQFRSLCSVLGLDGVADDPRFRRNRDRTANRAELEPLLVRALGTGTSQHWFEALLAVGVPCAPIQTIDEGVRFAQEVGLTPVVDVGHPAVPMIRNPVTFSETPARYRLAPPQVDQDGEAIRAWLAGGHPPWRAG